jgi:malonyl-CoA O-methyltransferase
MVRMTQSGSDRVQRSFSRSFDSYDAASGQQARIAARLVDALQQAGAPSHFNTVLELGCGTGHLTRRLTEHYSSDRLVLNDLTPQSRVFADHLGAAFLPGPAEQIAWPEAPDLIASASMVQWLADPAALVARAAEALAPGGWLAISGFGPDQYRELAALGSGAQAPGLCTAQALAAKLPADVTVISCAAAHHVQWFNTPKHVLQHLRRTGVNGRAQAPWTKSRLARFSDAYRAQFGSEKGVSLTYHPIWLVAQKPG